MKVLVTGAGGFVGGHLVSHLSMLEGMVAVAGTRNGGEAEHKLALGDLAGEGAATLPLEGYNAVVHCAGRAHIMRDAATDVLGAYRRENVHATRQLAERAAACGISRFVFLSSIKVNGEVGPDAVRITLSQQPAPGDPYGQSKLEAEQALVEISQQTGMEVCIVRPPLIYGPGVRANFLNLVRAVDLGIPLPLGAAHNKRSMIGIGNLVDFLASCLTNPSAANRIFLTSDGEDLSTADLVQRLSSLLGKSTRLIAIPPGVVAATLSLLGKRGYYERLFGSLELDTVGGNAALGWVPKTSVNEELARTVAWYRTRESR